MHTHRTRQQKGNYLLGGRGPVREEKEGWRKESGGSNKRKEVMINTEQLAIVCAKFKTEK